MNPSNLRCSAILSSILAASTPSGGALAGEYELVIEKKPMNVTGHEGSRSWYENETSGWMHDSTVKISRIKKP